MESIVKAGSVVKELAPYMTVEEITGDKVKCVWFVGSKLKRKTFRLDQLLVKVGANIPTLEEK